MHRNRILIIDYNRGNITKLVNCLNHEFQLNAVTNSFDAIEEAIRWQPDLILVEFAMPYINGLSIMLRLKNEQETENIPFVFLSGQKNPEDEIAVIRAGAYDYLERTVLPEILIAKLNNYIEIKNGKALLEKLTHQKKFNIEKLDPSFLFSSINAGEFRKFEVGKWHVHRCVLYVKALLKNMVGNAKFHELNTGPLPEAICLAVPYHDIGKTLLPENLILKPDRLTHKEYEIMKTHTTLGATLIAPSTSHPDNEIFHSTVTDVIKYHHERWDGSGYPHGLKERDIPLSARLMAIADQYDAIVSKRVYKDESHHYDAVRSISSESGRSFDPDLVHEFLNAQDEFLEIISEFPEN